jgi:multiple sugar transport system permease protein
VKEPKHPTRSQADGSSNKRGPDGSFKACGPDGSLQECGPAALVRVRTQGFSQQPAKRRARTIAIYAALMLIGLTTVVPLVWMAVTSLHPPRAQVPTLETLFLPNGWHFENYAYVMTFGELPVWRFALNSVIVTAGVVLFQLALCSLAAYAFARMQFRGRNALFLLFLATMLIPAPVLVVPLFMLVEGLGWLDTYWGLIIPYPYLSTAFGTFLLRQFFITIPRSLDDAARLDGCGEFGIFWHVILPSAKPALATVAAFAFIWTWTDFYWPLLASSSITMRTLEVGLSVFKDAYGNTQWPLQMTVAVIVLAPVLVFFLCVQRFFVRGAVTSGMKA